MASNDVANGFCFFRGPLVLPLASRSTPRPLPQVFANFNMCELSAHFVTPCPEDFVLCLSDRSPRVGESLSNIVEEGSCDDKARRGLLREDLLFDEHQGYFGNFYAMKN